MSVLHFQTEQELLTFAARLANVATEGTIIYLSGPLGAGKTTFTRGFLSGLGYTDKVKSPTYTLVEPYVINGKTVFHFDFYRLKDARELEHIGIYDYFSQNGVYLIEWPENGFPLLPEADLACHISFIETGREVRLVAHSPRGEEILRQL